MWHRRLPAAAAAAAGVGGWVGGAIVPHGGWWAIMEFQRPCMGMGAAIMGKGNTITAVLEYL
jgi:hypothetical protein